MFGTYADEDDDIFAPKPNSNLANLFDTCMELPKEEANLSLTYTAPKQQVAKNAPEPQTNDAASAKSSSQSQSHVAFARAVHTYKLEQNKYASQGRLGLALIKDPNKTNRIILYKDKQNIITSAVITQSLKITILDGKYIYFKDDTNESWSLVFDKDKDVTEFRDAIKKCDILPIMKSKDVSDHVMVDKKVENDSKEIGTIVEEKESIAPACTQVDARTIVEEKESIAPANTQVDVTHSTKAKILSLMEKMGQTKLLPKLQNTDLSDSSDTENSTKTKAQRKLSKPFVQPRKPSSDNNILATNTATSSNVPTGNLQYVLVNGQLLPVLTTAAPSFVPNINIPNAIGQPILHTLNPDQQLIAQSPQYFTNNPVTTSQSINSFDSLSVLLSENRTHNSEIRMNISRLENKLEKILEKVDDVKCVVQKPVPRDRMVNQILPNPAVNDDLLGKLKQYELLDMDKDQHDIKIMRLKLNDFEEFYNQNTKNVCKINEYENTIKNLELKFLSEFESLNKEQASNLAKIKEYENQIEQLQLKLKDFEDYYVETSSLKTDYENSLPKLTAYEDQINNLNLKVKSFEHLYEEMSILKKEHEETLGQLEKYKKDNTEISLKFKDLEKCSKEAIMLKTTYEKYLSKSADYENQIEKLTLKLKLHEAYHEQSETEKADEQNNLDCKIKAVMNSVYFRLNNKFSTKASYDAIFVQKTIAQTIKVSTLEVLKNINDQSNKSESSDKNDPNTSKGNGELKVSSPFRSRQHEWSE